MGLANAIKGARHSAQQITWEDESGTAVNLTSSTLTGYLLNMSNGRIRAIDGTLAFVTAASGIFSWTYGANDVMAAGKFKAQFIATFGDGSKDKSYITDWEVFEAYDAISNGSLITMHIADTWTFSIHNLEDISSYETIALVVRNAEQLTDNDALLLVRSDDGLIRVGGAAPVSAGGGSLTIGTGEIDILIAMSETVKLTAAKAGKYRWTVKGYDTTPNPDTGLTLASGQFVLNAGGVLSITP